MRVLVIGGNRYIGLDLVFELARRGHQVTVVNSHEGPLPDGAHRIHADRRRPGALGAALAGHRDAFDTVFDNTAYVPPDVEPMLELFAGRVEHYVFTSSQAVYRRSFVQPLREDARRHAPDDDDPRKAYGVGKVRCDDLLLDAWGRDGFPATCLRVGQGTTSTRSSCRRTTIRAAAVKPRSRAIARARARGLPWRARSSSAPSPRSRRSTGPRSGWAWTSRSCATCASPRRAPGSAPTSCAAAWSAAPAAPGCCPVSSGCRGRSSCCSRAS